MRWSRAHPFACLCLTIALIVGQLTACTSWNIRTIPPQPYAISDPVRVVRVNGTAVTLNGARIKGDTLFGTPTPNPTGAAVVAIPVSEIRTLSVLEKDGGKTTVLIVAVSIAVVAVLYFAATAAVEGYSP